MRLKTVERNRNRFLQLHCAEHSRQSSARGTQDTFYTTDGFALRSQTSTVQIHAMQRRGVPLRMIAPGRVFRRDTPDPTHNPMFFQVEGLCVDRGITMAHLKGTVGEFLRRMFGSDTVTRFRPSYFPFTEPSAEFDFSCFKCKGSGCRMQELRLDRVGRLRNGASQRAPDCWRRSSGILGVRFWTRNRSDGRSDVQPG
jgi:Phenylalanyl-tRNA synthetase alpha subunit